MNKKYYTVPELAEMLQVSESTVRWWIWKRQLKAFYIGRDMKYGTIGMRTRISQDALDEFISVRGVEKWEK